MTRRNLIALAAASPTFAPALQRRRPPNILFFFPDQHRPDWTGASTRLGIRTAVLDSIALEGTRFSSALCASPLCAPSRATLASGREYGRAGVRNNGQDYPLTLPTFYQSLREAGYHVLGCGKFDLHKATRDWGIDGRRFLPEWGFSDGIDNAGKMDAVASGAQEPRDPYMAYLHSRGLAARHVEDFRRRQSRFSYVNTDPTPLPEDAYCDNWIGANGLALLRSAPAGKPWFLQVNFTGPHSPLDITRRMERGLRTRTFPQPVETTQYTADRHVIIRQNYTAMVENIDRWLGLYLEEIQRRGETANTFIVYSSDHGEMLGDHERWGKSVPYHPAVGIPLYIKGPGVRRNVVSNALVSLIDLAPTFLDWAGAPRLRDTDSFTLRPLLEGKATAHRDHVLSGLDRWRMVFDGRYKLIRGFESRPPGTTGQSAGARTAAAAEPPVLLFDRKLDPQERINIARKSPHQVTRLSKLLGS
jgi:arylsulfatase A-like enzyme